MQCQRSILALRDLALHVCDLVLGFLALELDDARATSRWVGFGGCFLCFLGFGLGALGRRVDVGVRVEGRVAGRDDGVPDDELGGWDCRGRGGRVGGRDVDEDLLRVPVEEGG
jgi:hypothetical protein